MKLVLVTPYNTSNGQLMPQIAHADIATAAEGSFKYQPSPGENIIVQARLLTLNSGATLFVQETLSSIIAAS